MFIFLHSIMTNIRTIWREVFEYSNNIRIFKVARIRIRIVIFVKNYSNIRIIRIFVTTLIAKWSVPIYLHEPMNLGKEMRRLSWA